MSISASLVKELRERTGSGMMECKKALVETDGDLEAALEVLRKTGLAKADKKASRTAAEGLVNMKVSDDGKQAAIVEINCETDFVAKDGNFTGFCDAVTDCVMANKPADLTALNNLPLSSGASATVGETVKALIAKIGENMSVRRFNVLESANTIASYSHGGRIGVVVEMSGGNADLARDIAMHVAASKPLCVNESQVSAEVLDKERDIYSAQAAESGKPPEIVAKMVEGRIKKYLKEVTLVGQPFIKDPDTTVEKLLAKNNATVESFLRFEVGEGIEKKQENFADEVMAQIKGS